MTYSESMERAIQSLNGKRDLEMGELENALYGLLLAAMDEMGKKKVARCHNCKTILFLKRLPKSGQSYCKDIKCRKIMKLGHDKPASLKSIPACEGSVYREIRRYEGGYTE